MLHCIVLYSAISFFCGVILFSFFYLGEIWRDMDGWMDGNSSNENLGICRSRQRRLGDNRVGNILVGKVMGRGREGMRFRV